MGDPDDWSQEPTIAIMAIEPPTGGGIYQYTRSVIHATNALDVDVQVFYIDKNWADSDLYDSEQWDRVSTMGRACRRALRKICRGLHLDITSLGSLRRWTAPRIRRLQPDIVVYPTPHAMAFEAGFPYVMAIHDVQYRLNPQFDEVGNEEVVNRRSYIYGNGSTNATGILVDSDAGKEDVLRFYDVDEDRVFVLPFVPPDYLDDEANDVNEAFLDELPDRYIFYPAQFWEHKNHETLFKAIARLRNEAGIDVPCVCVGSEKNAYDDAMAVVESEGIDDLVTELGFVDDEKMYTLYEKAEALVMPTYLGPTNIPPMEAFKMGCPVITSDIHGLPEQVGDAGILIDPDSATELADAIESIWTNEELRQTLIERGYQKIESYNQEQFTQRFGEYIQTAIEEGPPS